jgi:hypothetical protein
MWGNKAGGWGGLGGIPQRTSVPNSQRVESNDEFSQGWQDKLGGIPQWIGGGGGDPIIPRTAAGTPIMAPGGEGIQSITAGQDYGSGAPGGAGVQSLTMGRDYNVAPQLTPYVAPSLNPEWARMNDLMQNATQQRTENQQRQQQAYDVGMMGNYGRNGLLPDNYSQAGYGQISGQDQAGAFGADGGTQLGGVDNSFITGAYTPSNSGAVYNPNPFSAGSFDPTGWGL